MTTLPICKLSLTGCMDPTTPTKVASKAVYYEVNSPLWSDNAAKSRAFVLPPGGKIHVKNCVVNAGDAALSECTAPNGVPNGTPDTGKWVFPVGTVMIKSFLFDGKLVETRLLMHVDSQTSSMLSFHYGFPPGSDWIGYNYQWNEAQTEATILPTGQPTAILFNTGQRTVTWTYPDVKGCVTCHTAAVGTLGPDGAQMNRMVKGANQIDALKPLFDSTAPNAPYPTPLVEPYANAALGLVGPPAGATLDQRARSYLSANCGFCHRPDVNDQRFDLRYGLSLYETGICNLAMQTGYPNPDGGAAISNWLDFAPGDHASSALWIRTNTPVAASDPTERTSVGRMPPLASVVVDSQAVQLIGQWIDSIKTCPGPDAGP